MGVIAESIVAYTQPLIDMTDGSTEQLEMALKMGQLCWNLAILPPDQLERSIARLQSDLRMGDVELQAFRREMIDPMIQRHREMFGSKHVPGSPFRAGDEFEWELEPVWGDSPDSKPPEKYPGTERYAPCPCDSGRKYKFCCGKKSR